MFRPVIYISAVSVELSSTVEIVVKAIKSLGYRPVWQDNTSSEAVDLKAIIRKKVDDSQAVLQIVGHRHGNAPEELDPDFGAASYTQYEALYARTKGIPIWYIILDDSHPVDSPNDEPESLRQLQLDYRLKAESYDDFFQTSSHAFSTGNNVIKLRDDFAKLRRRPKKWVATLITTSLIGLSGVTWITLHKEKPESKIHKNNRIAHEHQDAIISNVNSEPFNTIAEKKDAEAYYKDLTNSQQTSKALEFLTDAENRSRKPGEALTREQIRNRAYNILETELGLKSRLLSENLQDFALTLYNNPETDSLTKARAAYALNKFEEAEKLFLESEITYRTASEKSGEASPELLTKRIQSLKSAGQSATANLEYAKAVKHYRSASAISSLDKNPVEWARLRYALALALDDFGQYSEAVEILRQTVSVQERNLGVKHIETLNSRSNIAEALGALGRYSEAEKEHRTVLAIREQTLGAEHGDTLDSRNNLANKLQSQGKHTEAEEEYRAILAVYLHTLGNTHPHTLYARNNLANALGAQGKHIEAEQEHRAVLSIFQHTPGLEHPDTLASRNNLGNALRAQGNYAEAEKQHRIVLDIRRRVLGENHPLVFLSAYNLALCLKAQNKANEAYALAKNALSGWADTLGQSHPYVKAAQKLTNNLETESLRSQNVVGE